MRRVSGEFDYRVLEMCATLLSMALGQMMVHLARLYRAPGARDRPGPWNGRCHIVQAFSSLQARILAFIFIRPVQMDGAARIRRRDLHDALRVRIGCRSLGGADVATRHMQDAIARHLRLWFFLATFPLLFLSEQQPLQAEHERQERYIAWPNGSTFGRYLYL